mmetsp:Transcript_110800/g.175073  ORF Transcript_110800/g.175073 Transcript_110800/m.175073 type:complete len:90 (+) Transcript_110800:13-282(+)
MAQAYRAVGFQNQFDHVVRHCSSKHGICDRTGVPHQVLTGKDQDGIFRTLKAQPYPVTLCSRWASACLACDASAYVGKLSKLWGYSNKE